LSDAERSFGGNTVGSGIVVENVARRPSNGAVTKDGIIGLGLCGRTDGA
jgi:hypothetical protein